MARKTEKGGKFRNVHSRTWNMARKLKIMENEKHPLDDTKMMKSLKNVKNEKCTLQDLEYGGKLKIKENENNTCQVLKCDEKY